jgi:hypothetical protein
MTSEEFWQAEGLRFTFFYADNAPPASRPTWEQLFGEPPVTRTERPAQHIVIEEGNWCDMTLTVASHPERVDVVAKEAGSSFSFPVIGPFEASLQTFRSLVEKINLDDVVRVAFGAILLHSEDGMEGAYKTLGRLLPHIRLDADSREFFYQINKPFDHLVEGVKSYKFNSLRRWAAVSLQQINIDGETVHSKAVVASRLELDVNSSPELDLTAIEGKTGEVLEAVISNALSIARGENNA